MKERPILFSAPMVRALLDGSKTQTRRIIKPQPQMVTDKHVMPWQGDPAALYSLLADSGRKCPHGQPGDRIWVRETWRGVVSINPPECAPEYGVARYVPDREHCKRVEYAATQKRDGDPWRPSIHMPRWASRILLEIVSVRVERLNDCSDADATAEGVAPDQVRQISVFGANADERAAIYHRAAIAPFQRLWESINGADSWAANPWVWVIEFKRVPQHHHE